MFSSEGRVGIFYFFTPSQVQFAIRPDAAVESLTSPPWIQPGSWPKRNKCFRDRFHQLNFDNRRLDELALTGQPGSVMHGDERIGEDPEDAEEVKVGVQDAEEKFARALAMQKVERREIGYEPDRDEQA